MRSSSKSSSTPLAQLTTHLLSPEELLEQFPATRGGVRRFLEGVLFPPQSHRHQRKAGKASAEYGVRDLAQSYDLDSSHLISGLYAVSGAENAADGRTVLNTPDPDIDEDHGAAAFFDVDNTLIRGSSIILFAAGLYKRKYFTTGEILPQLWKQIKFRLSGKEDTQDMEQGSNEALEFVKGKDVSEIVQLAQEVYDEEMKDRIWEGTRKLAEQHLAAGQQVWLVTATPVELAQVIAQDLGFTGALGTVAVQEDGKYAGTLKGDILHGEGKKHAVAALAAYQNLDLNRCTAYSDSSNDLPMLSMVGHPVAINPDHKLRSIAKRRGWPVYDYRNVRKGIRAGVGSLVGAAALGGLGVLGVKATRKRKDASA